MDYPLLNNTNVFAVGNLLVYGPGNNTPTIPEPLITAVSLYFIYRDLYSGLVGGFASNLLPLFLLYLANHTTPCRCHLPRREEIFRKTLLHEWRAVTVDSYQIFFQRRGTKMDEVV